jgi:hypothetical protein
MAFFIPFALGAAATAVGLHIYKHKDCGKEECSCGCGDKCECGPDCDCGCNSSVKKKVTETAEFALEKIKSGLQILENNITESTLDKIKSGLQTAGGKIASLQEKLKEK